MRTSRTAQRIITWVDSSGSLRNCGPIHARLGPLKEPSRGTLSNHLASIFKILNKDRGSHWLLVVGRAYQADDTSG